MTTNAGIADYLSAAAAAKLLGVADVTVQRWAKAGRLAAQKLPGRTGAYVITRAEVDRVRAERSGKRAA